MNDENITRVSADEIRAKRAKGVKSRTDWTRIDNLTDEEIIASMRDDPDWADFVDVDWTNAQIVYPSRKSAISIRLDDDVIDFFKADGKGYQGRINAVLRHFMTAQKKGKKAG